jgi:hypothetical protein
VNPSEIELLRFDIDIDKEKEVAIELIRADELKNNLIEEEFT